MSTEIKAIKCPQCGSTENTELGQNRFKCKKCGTEYFLDGDNISADYNVDNSATNIDENEIINIIKTQGALAAVKYYHEKTGLGLKECRDYVVGLVGKYNIKLKVRKAGCGLLIALFIVIVIIAVISIPWGKIFSTGDNGGDNSGIKGSVEMAEAVVSQGKPYILILSDDYNNGNDNSYFAYMDAVSGKIVKNEKLPVDNIRTLTFDYTVFDNGDAYLVFNRKIFAVDNNNMNIQDVTNAMFAGDSLYASGIATIKTNDNDGDCFQVMTNMGQYYYYYPIVKKSYSPNRLYTTEDKAQPNAKDTTIFAFTESNNSNIADKIMATELLKIIYKYNNGDAQRTLSSPSWEVRDYGNYDTVLNFHSAFVVSYTNLTPGRLYFHPDIVYQDTGYLLIAVSATAAPDAPTSLQRINTQTGALMWTLPAQYTSRQVLLNVHADGKFVIKMGNYNFMVVDDDGKIVRNIDLNKN